MALDMLVPFAYQRSLRSLGWLQTWLLEHHHPEYVRRLVAWLDAQGGLVGVGGGWRPDGTQPDLPGFAPEGRSFHQNQRYSDGFIGAAAVDLVCRNGTKVHRSPTWAEVPRQGGVAARTWGVHCNIDSEPWHMQPVEIDGWQSWTNAGSPAPVAGYPLPTGPPPLPLPPTTVIPKGVAAMGAPLIIKYGGSPDSTPDAKWAGYFSFDGITRHGVSGMHHAAQLVALGAIDAKTGQSVTSPNWSGVTFTKNLEELDEWLTPGRD